MDSGSTGSKQLDLAGISTFPISRVEDDCLGLPGRAGKSLVVRKEKVQREWSEGVRLVGAHQGTHSLFSMLAAP